MPKPPATKALTPKQERFVAQYLVDQNGTAAAKRAGYSERTAHVMAQQNLRQPAIKAAIETATKVMLGKLGSKAEDVLQQLVDIANADPRELISFHRTCCRFCWGVNFLYQRTANEMERAKAAFAATVAEAKRERAKAPGRFDSQGGIGYNAKRDPNPECQECFGDGVGQSFIADTRTIGHAAARLYAGVKQTKDGFEVKLHSIPAALEMLCRHHGLFNDKQQVTGDLTINIKRLADGH